MMDEKPSGVKVEGLLCKSCRRGEFWLSVL